MTYEKLPIVDAARRCGLMLDVQTLRREEIEAACPFCGDHGSGKYHLSLNTSADQYRCNLCGACGNSVTLYARLHGIGNKETYRALAKGSKIYPMPRPPVSPKTGRQPLALAQRHAVHTTMPEHLVLLDQHRENLLKRGFSEECTQQNQYRSMPETEQGRRLFAALPRSGGQEFQGLPGFRTRYGEQMLSGLKGFLIPVRDRDGLIQGLKIRLDDAGKPDRKYRWLSTRGAPNGTRSYSWVHVTGDTSRKRIYLTEGSLKGDVVSFLGSDTLFACIGGVNAIGGLRKTLEDLKVREVVEAMDSDQMTNSHVGGAALAMRKEVQRIPGIRYYKYTWDPAYKGVDDYPLSRTAIG